jgi:hypothetical protein
VIVHDNQRTWDGGNGDSENLPQFVVKLQTPNLSTANADSLRQSALAPGKLKSGRPVGSNK